MSPKSKPGPKPPYRQLMFEIHIPRSDSDPTIWSTTCFVHMLDETGEEKKKLGPAIPANGLGDVERVLLRLLLERRALVVDGNQIRPQEQEQEQEQEPDSDRA